MLISFLLVCCIANGVVVLSYYSCWCFVTLFMLFVALPSTHLSYSPLCYRCCCPFVCCLFLLLHCMWFDEILPHCHHLIGDALVVCYVSDSSCCTTTIGPLLHVPWWNTTLTHCLMQVVELLYNWKERGKNGLSIFNGWIIPFFFNFLFFLLFSIFYVFFFCF
jgi:hypothetical protein